MSMARLFPILLMMAFVSVNSPLAHDETEMIEQHVHVHGHWSVFVAMDGERLTLSFSGPATDVLGFEHIPETEAEREAIRLLLETLGTQDTISLTQSAKCKPAAEPEIMLPEGFDMDGHRPDTSQSSHGEIDAEAPDVLAYELHNDEDKHDEHHYEAEIEAVYVFSCGAPRKLVLIEHRLFDLYPSIEKIEAVFLTDSKQGVQALTRSSPDLRLK